MPNIPLPSEGASGASGPDGNATATCFCSAVQLSFPTNGEGFVDSFICHCTDCHKITASLFASNFIIKDDFLKHTRGQEKLTKFSQNKTIATGNTMSNYFCSVCGTLMYRVSSGYPGVSILRIGTIDDFDLQQTIVKPRHEQFADLRPKWLQGAEGVEQHGGNFYTGA